MRERKKLWLAPIIVVLGGHPVRRFASFTEAADEAPSSRLYAGLHFPMGNENGKVLGSCVGRVVLERLHPRLAMAR